MPRRERLWRSGIRAERMWFRRKHAEQAEKRPSVDWMDFEKPNGGPTRRAVNLGIEELPSERHADDLRPPRPEKDGGR